MHEAEKSDQAIVAVKPANNLRATGRGVGGAKGRGQGKCGTVTHAPGTGPGKRVTGAGPQPREAAKERKKERFTALLHHVDVPMLRTAFHGLRRDAAPGADGLTWRGLRGRP